MNNEKDRARNSPAPFPYLAIAREIQAAIARGELSPGERAPSTREITRLVGGGHGDGLQVLATLRREGAIETKAGSGQSLCCRLPGSDKYGHKPPVRPSRAQPGPPAATTTTTSMH